MHLPQSLQGKATLELWFSALILLKASFSYQCNLQRFGSQRSIHKDQSTKIHSQRSIRKGQAVKKITALISLSLALIGAAMIVTRPDEEDYAAYLSEQMATRVEASLCRPDDFSQWLGRVGEALSSACEGILSGGESLSKEEVQRLIIDNTDYNNRIFFSTYVTETPLGSYRALGLLNRFIIREQVDQKQTE